MLKQRVKKDDQINRMIPRKSKTVALEAREIPFNTTLGGTSDGSPIISSSASNPGVGIRTMVEVTESGAPIIARVGGNCVPSIVTVFTTGAKDARGTTEIKSGLQWSTTRGADSDIEDDKIGEEWKMEEEREDEEEEEEISDGTEGTQDAT